MRGQSPSKWHVVRIDEDGPRRTTFQRSRFGKMKAGERERCVDSTERASTGSQLRRKRSTNPKSHDASRKSGRREERVSLHGITIGQVEGEEQTGKSVCTDRCDGSAAAHPASPSPAGGRR